MRKLSVKEKVCILTAPVVTAFTLSFFMLGFF